MSLVVIEDIPDDYKDFDNLRHFVINRTIYLKDIETNNLYLN
jgi:hypothetical protein